MRAAMSGLVLLTALAAGAPAFAQDTNTAVPSSASIAALLPKASGQQVCYAVSNLKDRVIDVEDWSERAVTSEPVPGLFDAGGRQVTRPVPKTYRDQKVNALVLAITRDDLNVSEPYLFQLSVAIKGRRALRAAGPCNLFDPAETGLRPGERGQAVALGCGVECDGGSVAVERQGVDLAVVFGKSGLRMTPGCGDERRSFRLQAREKEQIFRLQAVSAKQCRSLRK